MEADEITHFYAKLNPGYLYTRYKNDVQLHPVGGGGVFACESKSVHLVFRQVFNMTFSVFQMRVVVLIVMTMMMMTMTMMMEMMTSPAGG